ncbi:hypothetical protein DFH06DRAFT_1117900 [Mycena polygramma]|nr:hypothetical protein DFH06DRAFT_1117900 [Mycena polygramma]
MFSYVEAASYTTPTAFTSHFYEKSHSNDPGVMTGDLVYFALLYPLSPRRAWTGSPSWTEKHSRFNTNEDLSIKFYLTAATRFPPTFMFQGRNVEAARKKTCGPGKPSTPYPQNPCRAVKYSHETSHATELSAPRRMLFWTQGPTLGISHEHSILSTVLAQLVFECCSSAPIQDRRRTLRLLAAAALCMTTATVSKAYPKKSNAAVEYDFIGNIILPIWLVPSFFLSGCQHSSLDHMSEFASKSESRTLTCGYYARVAGTTLDWSSDTGLGHIQRSPTRSEKRSVSPLNLGQFKVMLTSLLADSKSPSLSKPKSFWRNPTEFHTKLVEYLGQRTFVQWAPAGGRSLQCTIYSLADWTSTVYILSQGPLARPRLDQLPSHGRRIPGSHTQLHTLNSSLVVIAPSYRRLPSCFHPATESRPSFEAFPAPQSVFLKVNSHVAFRGAQLSVPVVDTRPSRGVLVAYSVVPARKGLWEVRFNHRMHSQADKDGYGYLQFDIEHCATGTSGSIEQLLPPMRLGMEGICPKPSCNPWLLWPLEFSLLF